MNEITIQKINEKEIPAVTSLQVADAFGKQHAHVMRDIRNVTEKCSEFFNASNFGLVEYTDAKGEKRPMYILSKDGLMMVTMGYTTLEAMAIKETYIARFNEMEEELRNRVPGLPNFDNPALAARAWAEQYERRQLAEAQRDEAIRTKAQIGSKREATAMATASAAVRKINSLEDELGRGKRFKFVKAIPWLPDVFEPSRGMYSVVGKTLKRLSVDLGYPIEKIVTPEYPDGINAYHVNVIAAFREKLKRDPAVLGKYRLKWVN
ncbi:Rha family transcriptional regulator [Oxalobacter aliiformigenes]|uniref:Rha family transcriptional regulator n=1 Tax=Oxalobacter aliiformigenes TaxID=2946593 RepID=UPI0022AF7A41|nr:Rha family transcriptional regulator [Oxalobacter aliiformigenes]MCZ4065663.1 Rha family transcriptional regulator [Oxalobacter aliiformigenes]WAV99678.1 Rha family transcriptional regulator [Oxalobacter aliiformigenes]